MFRKSINVNISLYLIVFNLIKKEQRHVIVFEVQFTQKMEQPYMFSLHKSLARIADFA